MWELEARAIDFDAQPSEALFALQLPVGLPVRDLRFWDPPYGPLLYRYDPARATTELRHLYAKQKRDADAKAARP